jgi:hypothetical protein
MNRVVKIAIALALLVAGSAAMNFDNEAQAGRRCRRGGCGYSSCSTGYCGSSCSTGACAVAMPAAPPPAAPTCSSCGPSGCDTGYCGYGYGCGRGRRCR